MPATLDRPRRKKASRRAHKKTSPQLSRTQQPKNMSLDEWQIALRQEYGRAQNFEMANLNGHPIFSDFSVTNPQSQRTYRVAIRGERLGDSRCSCPDFATNTLGTCKHVEFVLERLRRQRGGKQALKQGWHATGGEIWLRHGAQRKIVYRAGDDAPQALVELSKAYFGQDGVLRDSAIEGLQRFLVEAENLGHPIRCDDDALDMVARQRDSIRRRTLLDEKYADARAFDGLIRATLYPYQRDGIRFAAAAGRALLGDEMGLGKTVQALAVAELMAREFGVERVLVICPASLKHQWNSEIEKFTDRSVTVIEGLTHQRAEKYAADTFFKVVNYDVLHRDLDAIGHLSPDLVILDEAQRIKNWRTRAANAVKSIASPYALVLTGTPLENRLEELYSIVQFVDQQRLGPLFRFIANHQVTEDGSTRVVGYKGLSRIGETLGPILLRRRKKEVLDQLPPRTDKTFFVPMTDRQRKYHEENAENVARLVQKWRRHHFLTEADQRQLQIALLRMRMSCDDAWLVDGETRSGHKVGELELLLEELLENGENRVVIFSQWTRMHELVTDMMNRHEWSYAYLHGGVPSNARKALIDKFREPHTRVFLSTDAGGVGLNLQHASTVINLDLPWNPAVLEQRIGRVHRMGQQRNVQVMNFVSEGTIEHGMLRVLSFKKDLFEGVLDGGSDSISLGGPRLQKFMETVESVSRSVPEPAPVAEQGLATAAAEVGTAVAKAVPETDANRAAPVDGNASLRSLLEAGTKLLQGLQSTLTAPRREGAAPPVAVERDAESGRTSLRITLPEPEMLQRLATAAAPLLELLRESTLR